MRGIWEEHIKAAGAGAQPLGFAFRGLKFIGQDSDQARAGKLWDTDRISRWRVSTTICRSYLQKLDNSKKIKIMARYSLSYLI